MKTNKFIISVLGLAATGIGLSTFAAQVTPSNYTNTTSYKVEQKSTNETNTNTQEDKNKTQENNTQNSFDNKNYQQFRQEYQKDNVLKNVDTKDEFNNLLNLKKTLESGDYTTANNIAKKLGITIDDSLMQKLGIKSNKRIVINKKIQELKTKTDKNYYRK